MTIGRDGIDALDGLPLSALTLSPRLRSIGTELLGEDTVEMFERSVTCSPASSPTSARWSRSSRARKGCTGSRSPAAMTARFDRRWRLDRLQRALPHRRRASARRTAAPGSRSMPPPRRCGSRRSAAGGTGTEINLERALKVGDELGGHIVAGHADGLATVLSARGSDRHGAVRACARPHELARFIAPKGSVALDGVSLTVNEVDGRHASRC